MYIYIYIIKKRKRQKRQKNKQNEKKKQTDGRMDGRTEENKKANPPAICICRQKTLTIGNLNIENTLATRTHASTSARPPDSRSSRTLG